MENLKKENGANVLSNENTEQVETVSLEKAIGKDYKSLARSIVELRSILGSDKPYPILNRSMMHIYRHDVLELHGVTRRVHYTFEDMTDDDPQSVDSLIELMRTSNILVMDYLKDASDGRCERGDNVDHDGWNIEMRSAVFDGRLYPIDFCIFNLDFEHPEEEREYELSLEDIDELLTKIRLENALNEIDEKSKK